jgi:hypothetical protein
LADFSIAGVLSSFLLSNLTDKDKFLFGLMVSLAEIMGSIYFCEWGKLRGLLSLILVYDLAVFFIFINLFI